MPRVVPQPDYWLREVVFVTQRTQTRCTQEEVSTHRGLQPDPPRVPYAQEMPAGENQHIPFDRAHAFDYAVCSRPHLGRRFPAGAAIAKQLPLRALPVDVSRTAPFIRAIIPFNQVPVDFSH